MHARIASTLASSLASTVASVVATAVLLSCTVALAGPPKVQPDKKSILAARLLGSWTGHAGLSTRLTGKAKHKIKTMTVTSDPSVLEKLPAKFHGYFAKKRIYLAGHLLLNGKVRFPFLLSTLGGSGHVFFFRSRDGVPMGDSESFYVMLAAAKQPGQDLLFLGGDTAREPFMALERKRD